MNFHEACASMAKRIAVQSLVSKTTYEMSKKGLLLAEGLEVPVTHLTVEEANGEWQEVTVIESMEEFQKLSDEEVERILQDSVEHFKFNQTVREQKDNL